MVIHNYVIKSLKHNGQLHRKWLSNIMLFSNAEKLIGYNDQTVVVEADETRWLTQEPGLFILYKENWFNIIIIFTEKDYYYYCNLSSPVESKGNELTYIDYDIDIIVKSDYTYTIVDKEEFTSNKEVYHYPNTIIQQIESAVTQLTNMIESKEAPFNVEFIEYWQHKIEQLNAE